MSVPENGECRDRIAAVTGDRVLAEALARSIESSLDARAGAASPVEECFRVALESAAVDVRRHRRGQLLTSWLQDDAELTTAEVVGCLRFIYWHMINKFQGDLTELLAMGTVSTCAREWMSQGLLPREARTVWGRSIRMRSVKRPMGWLKAVDALIATVERERVIVHGVVEIKSYPVTPARARRQLRSHLDRLAAGAMIDGREWRSPDISLTVPAVLTAAMTGFGSVPFMNASSIVPRSGSSRLPLHRDAPVAPQPQALLRKGRTQDIAAQTLQPHPIVR